MEYSQNIPPKIPQFALFFLFTCVKNNFFQGEGFNIYITNNIVISVKVVKVFMVISIKFLY